MQVASGGMVRGGRTGLLLIIAWLLSVGAQADHIIGGDMSMRAVGTKPGLFRIQLNQYLDENKTVSGNRDAFVILRIYRKQNPVLIERLTLYIKETLPLTFNNVACASLRQLSFTQARYYDNHQFDPNLYTDPGGYYIVWERCCRNDALTNVNTAAVDGVAMTFYLEFPPMLKKGINVTNSAPEFRVPNGDYICINKPFTFDAGATDADGDQLRYSLVTPLNGYTTRLAPGYTDETPRNSYPTINWGPGYSLANIIPGSPPLSIDQNTGKLSVKASAQGLYLFTVQCEEFRNGERIGVVRRDFQLPVVDCSKNTPPPAVVMTSGKVATDLSWCGSQPLVLSVEKNSDWAYQWQKDGTSLRGSTSDTLQVRTPGVYSVVKSQAKACANDTTSQAVKVTFTTAPSVKVSLTTPKPYCAGDTLVLKADGQPGYKYRWQYNGKDVAGQQATLQIYQAGNYGVFARIADMGCEGKDSVKVTIEPRPTAQIKPSSLTFCTDGTIQLMAGNTTGYQYQWQQNGNKLTDTTSQLVVKQAGNYQVTVSAPTGCTATSLPVTLTQYARPVIQFDSIASVCLDSNATVALTGQPTGGTYTGQGVQGSRFDPMKAGVGRHELTYTITSDKGCLAEQNRWVEVLPSVNLTGQTTYILAKGQSVQLLTRSDQPISRYQWSPATYLSQPDVSSPIAIPSETTLYEVTAMSEAGCTDKLSILVDVATLLYFPSAFSPNADGQNDVWVIPNISSFPQSEVSIYNRWGQLIFFSRGYTQPWDGTYQQEPVQAGVYTYQIRTGTGPLDTTYRGQLTVIH
ncbi:gliding motility-associated C-terminal domain-containing protein [Spirosoma sp. KCTC 42546]|uniref:gliding motility-associated C-terminal domain-containing protein n=1 Tax=Spirosoma sp. KCTC 42546 TaxID=2520506 RepID=UPI001FEE0313|nr:gliding motility-associated C-terminal domain-containing protein [Spirosoma sp. KCTC 42546]